MAKFRKIALFISIIIFTTAIQGNVYAQRYYVEDKRTFYGGASFGATFSQLDGDNYAGFHKVGLTGGAIVYAQIAKHFAMSLEMLYTEKGSRAHKEVPTPNFRMTDYKANLNYIEIPVLFNYFDKRKSHFGLGVSYSQLLSASEEITTAPDLPASFNEDDYPFLKSDINAIASVNLHLYKGFFLNVRYQYSLAPVRKVLYPGVARTSASGQYNNFWAFRFMYILN